MVRKNKKNGKKGAIGVLQGVILVVVAAAILMVFIGGFMEKAKPKQLEAACKASVLAREKGKFNLPGPGGLDPSAKLSPLLCKTQDKEIEGDKEKVMKEVADSLARCWWMFNEGKTESILETIKVIEGGKVSCFKCYTLLLRGGSGFGEGDQITMGELTYYMANNEYPSAGRSYGDYTKFGTAQKMEKVIPDGAYSVVFFQGYGGEARAVLGVPDDKILGSIHFTDCLTG